MDYKNGRPCSTKVLIGIYQVGILTDIRLRLILFATYSNYQLAESSTEVFIVLVYVILEPLFFSHFLR